MLTVPVDEDVIPVIKAKELVEVIKMKFVPVVFPITLPVVVPIFTLPAVTYIPVKIPGLPVAPLVVLKLILDIVLF